MTASLTMAERASAVCPACGNEIPVELSVSPLNAVCPQCGHSLWCYKRTVSSVVVLDVIHGTQAEYEDVAELFESLLGSGDVPRIVVNLSDIDYVNSSFVAGLVGLNKRVRSAGGTLVLCDLRPMIRELLTQTHLDKFFQMSDSETEALRVCRRRASSS